MSESIRRVHWRVPYYRASFQGGDTQSPLCEVPITGYSGDEQAGYDMTDKPGLVTCPWCSWWLANGGLSARRAWLERCLVLRKQSRLQCEEAA